MKTALITGGAKRVGRGLVQGLARRGFAVAVHYRHSREEAEDLAREIRAQNGICEVFCADLAETEETERLVKAVSESLSPPVCLVNNASTFAYDNAEEFTATGWDAQFAVNLRAPALLSRDFFAALPDGEEGFILNLLDQKIGNLNPVFFSYTVSKVALEATTRLMAMAYAPRVRVCAVAPGLTLPSGGQTREQFEAHQANSLLPEGSSVDAIVDAALYLLDAKSVTGQVIYVDGGERFQGARDYSDIIEVPE